MPGKCKFKRVWLTNSDFKEWLGQASKQSEAKCNVCMSIIDVSSMGIGALKCHMNGKKHKKAMESRQSLSSLGQLFQPDTTKVNDDQTGR